MFRHALPRAAAAITLFGVLVASAGALSAQPAANKKVLTFADYDVWRAAIGVTLSRDGQYVAYLVAGVGTDGEAVVRHIPSGKEFRFARGSSGLVGLGVGTTPHFTPDSKRVLLPLSPTKAELDKAKADKLKPEDFPKAGLSIVDLASGKELDRITSVSSYQVAGEGPGFLVYRKSTAEPGKGLTGLPTKGKAPTPPATPTKTTGSDLYIRDLNSTVERTIPDVTEFSLSNDEKTLVYVVSSKTEAKNGVYAMNPRFGTAATPLKSGPGRYSGLTWDEKQTKLAFFYDDSQIPPANLAPPPHTPGSPGTPAVEASRTVPPRWRVFVWERHAKEPTAVSRVPLGTSTAGFAALVSPVVTFVAPTAAANPVAEVFGPDTPGLKKGWTLTGSSLSFSQDGTKLYVNTAPARPATTVAVSDDIQLDIWHWKDAAIQPMQKLRAAADRNRSYGAVLLLDSRQLRHLSDDNISVQQPGTGDWAIGSDDRKYRHTTGYAYPVPSDYTLVNIRTGETKSLLSASTTSVNFSPNGKFIYGFDGKDWFTISVPDGKKVNLTAKLGVKFFNEDYDMPSDPNSYGITGWTPDGKFVLVSDRFDIWKLAADGSSAENLTKTGRTQGIRFTLLRPRSAEDHDIRRTVDLTKPLLLGAENLSTYDTGFFRLEPGGSPKLLLMGARAYGNPVKAHDADVYMLTVQTFSQYPDYYVTTPDFHELKRVTDINPKVKDYNWGKAELIKYTSTDGDKLSGVLIKPENFDPTKKYPMVVYIYERLSENLHTFRLPTVSRGQIINPTFYASNGYLVLMPDIAYKVGAPGPSSLKCVLPAIQCVVDKGYVDEKAIGINGQSWGGYQIAYMITQTNRFKAAVAGAPVSNMFSAYSGIRWGSGLPRQFQYEHGQSRIGATPWEAPLKFMENSPVFAADRVTTPLLMIHNDQDDAVPWYQGIEYFLALRRLNKEVYMLNYNGQPHNLTSRAAARDFAMRMFQFFEHHLKGKPAPEWMEKGVPYIDREKEKEQWRKLFGTAK
jgi:dipeptidyl aminopeptidase/acylaminoacyl peptidase